MLEIRGPNVFAGYWQMPEKTRAEFRADGFFISGDLGRIDDRGYVWILGRGKDLVISGGFNVYPKEVELQIDALPGIVESAVIGLPHSDLGEAVTAVVVGDEKTANEASILAALRGRLAGYKLPKRVLFVDSLPRNTMAKVQKNLLRETYRDLYRGGGAAKTQLKKIAAPPAIAAATCRKSVAPCRTSSRRAPAKRFATGCPAFPADISFSASMAASKAATSRRSAAASFASLRNSAASRLTRIAMRSSAKPNTATAAAVGSVASEGGIIGKSRIAMAIAVTAIDRRFTIIP